jgi:hypothetical protein
VAISETPYRVPVSRTRRVWLKEQLATRVSLAK